MPRLIPPELGNGKRPSSPLYKPSTNPTAVPVLDVSDATHELVAERHAAALDPNDDTPLLTGHLVVLDNGRPAPGSAGHFLMNVGASTLHEAATEVVGALPIFALNMPAWVACSDSELAAVLAEHYTIKGYHACKVIDMSEVPA